MTLHLINKCDAQCWLLMQQALSAGDAVLLSEDAVLATLPQHPRAADLAAVALQCQLHAQAEDLAVRGISDKIRADVAKVSYRDVVALCLRHARVVTWR